MFGKIIITILMQSYIYFIFILLLEGERNHDYIRFIILCSPQDYVDSDGENV